MAYYLLKNIFEPLKQFSSIKIRSKQFFYKNNIVFLTLTCLFIGSILTSYVNIDIDQKIANTFLISVLQIISTIISILVAISIIAIEHTTSKYSNTILKFYKTDRVIWCIIIHSIFVIGFRKVDFVYNLRNFLIDVFYMQSDIRKNKILAIF